MSKLKADEAWRSAIQTGVAVALSWWVASDLLGHPDPISAPVVAAVAIGAGIQDRSRRMVEVVLGVATGIAVATLLVAELGHSPVIFGLIVTAAMLLALVLGGSELLVTQVAIASILIVASGVDSSGTAATRLVDALVGGVTAGAVSLLIAPPDPIRLLKGRVDALLTELAAVLDEVAAALALSDQTRAEEALDRARGADALAVRLQTAGPAAADIARFVPIRRPGLAHVHNLVALTPHLDHALRHTRVLARAAVAATLLPSDRPGSLANTVARLAASARQLQANLGLDAPGRGPERAPDGPDDSGSANHRDDGSPTSVAVLAAAKGVAADLELAAGQTA